jgi:RNA polymerase sigma-70 factor (ECF subfamily)
MAEGLSGTRVQSAESVDAAACEKAVRSIYDRRSQEMFGFARRLGLRDDDAADAVQECMLRLHRELSGGTAINDPEAWVFRVLYRIGMDSHRLERRIGGLAERLSSAAALRRSDGGDPSRRLETDDVWREVDRLPARQRAVLYLRYRADLPFERIAVALGISAGAARGHASTGLATLRLRLGEERLR